MTATGPAMTLQVRDHDKVMEPYSLDTQNPRRERKSQVSSIIV